MKYQTIVERITKEWGLHLSGDLIESPTGCIAFAFHKNQPAVLKILATKPDERVQHALQHYNGNGAVLILEHEENVVLMLRACPGTHLKELTLNNEDEKATQILCDVIEKLHSHKNISGDFQTIADWAEGFDRYLSSNDNVIPSRLVTEAKERYFALVKSQAEPVLLHGDLHHDNILYDEKKGWLAIDPKGVIGEPCYEVGAFLRNPIDRPDIFTTPDIIRLRVDIISERLNYDKRKVIDWAFTQSVLAACWSREDGLGAEWAINAAECFKKLG